MDKTYESGRERQRKIFILILVIFIIVIVITAILSITKPKETDKETTILTDVQAEIVDNEIIVSEEQTVTGENGENNTLIPATVKKVVDAKVLQVSINGSDTELSMIGISIPKEKETDAINYLNEVFKTSKDIWLQYDEQTVNEKNQNLCYVWLSKDANTYLVSSCKKYMLQAKLINEGLAEPIEEYPNSRYEYALSSIGGINND